MTRPLNIAVGGTPFVWRGRDFKQRFLSFERDQHFDEVTQIQARDVPRISASFVPDTLDRVRHPVIGP